MAKKPVKSLHAYVVDQTKAVCKVCALPAEVQRQIKERPQSVRLPVVIEWVQRELGVVLTTRDFVLHNNLRHDATGSGRASRRGSKKTT